MKPLVNSNHWLALTVSGIIFLGSVSAFAFIYSQINLQVVNTGSAYAEMAQAQQQETQSQSVIDTLAQTQDERANLESFFVNDGQTVAFIQQIEAVGAESGSSTVSITSISDDDLSASPAGATGAIRTHIDIKGSWVSAMRALHLLENLPYGESIDNVRAVPNSEKTWDIGLDLNAVLIH